MLTSFVATPADQYQLLQGLSRQFSHPTQLVNDGRWAFLFNSMDGDSALEKHHCSEDGQDIYLIGEILNLAELREIAAMFDSSALTANPAHVAYTILSHLGAKAHGLLEGGYTILLRDNRGGLRVVTDLLGLSPVTLVNPSRPWITTELKTLSAISDLVFEFEDPAALRDPLPDYYCPIRNVRRVKPGEVLAITSDGMGHYMVESRVGGQFTLQPPQQLTSEDAKALIDRLLGGSVNTCVMPGERTGLPLSGGLDSSVVASLAAQQAQQLWTYSIGTEESNEFAFSRIVADYIGSSHREFVIDHDDILRNVVNAVYYNEIYDGLSAEIQSPLFSLYEKCRGDVDALITGYGSDLLFGGVLGLDTEAEQVNPLLWQQIYRTRWTGELSRFGALNHGIKLRHPFWNTRLIAFCMNLHPSLKLSRDEVKIVLRNYADGRQLLPHEITWRKKIGIHEGSSINAIFARRLNTQTGDYQKKTRFSYELYKGFLADGQKPEDVDIEGVISRCH